MKTEDFIKQVDECVANNWGNSDIWEQAEKMLEKIAEHLKICPYCAEDFQDHLDQTEMKWIHEMDSYLGTTTLKDWICDKPRTTDGTFVKENKPVKKPMRVTEEEKELIAVIRKEEMTVELYSKIFTKLWEGKRVFREECTNCKTTTLFESNERYINDSQIVESSYCLACNQQRQDII